MNDQSCVRVCVGVYINISKEMQWLCLFEAPQIFWGGVGVDDHEL